MRKKLYATAVQVLSLLTVAIAAVAVPFPHVGRKALYVTVVLVISLLIVAIAAVALPDPHVGGY